jgi:hypothetical protein
MSAPPLSSRSFTLFVAAVAAAAAQLVFGQAPPTAAAPGKITAVDGPDPREIPLPRVETRFADLPTVDRLPERKEMPDVLTFADGTKVTTREQWQRRRDEMKQMLAHYAVGHMPPPPGNVKGYQLKSESVLDGTVTYRVLRLTFGPAEKLELHIGVFTPADRAGPFPGIIMPGGTPPGAPVLALQPHPPGQGRGVNALLPVEPAAAPADPAASRSKKSGPQDAGTVAARYTDAFKRGYAVVVFNNNDCGEDTTLRNPDGSWAFRNTRFYPAYPGYDWGLLASWAWGASRIVDYLETDPAIDKARLIISGGSRTGKAAMVAAAFDDRFAMAAPCVTGGGGMPAYRFSGAGRGGKEGLGDMMRKYPNWFSPHLRQFWGQTDKLPFDAHWFVALAAPRPFIALEGIDDGVSLMNGVKQTWLHAQPAYKFLNAADRLGVNYANHGHAFTPEDMTALLDFADKHLRGKSIARRFDQFPPESSAKN